MRGRFCRCIIDRMKRTSNRKVFFAAVGLCAFLVIITFFAGLKRIPEPALWKGTPHFKAQNAYQWTKTLARDFPNRVPWRPERAQAAAYLKKQFSSLGYN